METKHVVLFPKRNMDVNLLTTCLNNFEAEIMVFPQQLEAEIKNQVAHKKTCI